MTEQEIAVKLENHENRILNLETNISGLQDLIISVKEMALSVRNLAEEQKELKNEMKISQQREGNLWREVKKYCITLGIGLIAGYLFNRLFI